MGQLSLQDMHMTEAIDQQKSGLSDLPAQSADPLDPTLLLPEDLEQQLDGLTSIEQVRILGEYLRHHNHLYYDLDQPVLTDRTYDAVLAYLEALERQDEALRLPDSPTQFVGGKAQAKFSKVEHEVPMLSLQDYFSKAELDSFFSKLQSANDGNFPSCVVELKIDGLSVSLEYVNGQYTRGSTRGDGRVGEDMTENLKGLSDIPLTLSDPIPYLEVRAEVYMPYTAFEALNQQQDQNGQKRFANPRNAAAGSLRQLDPQVTQTRGLSLFAFNIQQVTGKVFSTHSEALIWLESQGFPVVSPRYLCADVEAISAAIDKIASQRAKLPFGIDGAVIKVNDLSLRQDMGETIKVPRWAAAYKYPPEQVKTIVEAIDVQVGRTGVLTPLAVLKPVRVDGSLVSRATLHNAEFIQEKDIRVGDLVVIQKAGDVIPAIVSVDLTHRPAGTTPFKMPAVCPSCGTPVVSENHTVALRCPSPECPAQRYRHLLHFVSKDAMDIQGLGKANIQTFIDAGLLKDVADLYRMNRADLEILPNFKEKSIQNLLTAIENSKQRPLSKLIYGLGIRHIGEVAAQTLAHTFGSLSAIASASREDLLRLPDFGDQSADAVYSFFQLPESRHLIQTLTDLGLKVHEDREAVSNKPQIFSGETWVITGTLQFCDRQTAKNLLEAHGAKVTGSVSRKTTALLCGADPGSKYDKARQFGVRILTEEAWLNLLKEHQ